MTRDEYIKLKADGIDLDKISFDLVDASTVARLKKTLPKKNVDLKKDTAWNEKQIKSKLLAGIQNGDSIDKIAQSILTVVGNNHASAIRNARTMFTEAENGGRLDSYRNLADQGVVQKKVWMATADDRTRPSHIDLDGEEKDIDERFSNGCMFPADGNGPAEEVWMCRCSMTDSIVGFKRSDGSVSYLSKSYSNSTSLHEKQIKEEKERRG